MPKPPRKLLRKPPLETITTVNIHIYDYPAAEREPSVDPIWGCIPRGDVLLPDNRIMPTFISTLSHRSRLLIFL